MITRLRILHPEAESIVLHTAHDWDREIAPIRVDTAAHAAEFRIESDAPEPAPAHAEGNGNNPASGDS